MKEAFGPGYNTNEEPSILDGHHSDSENPHAHSHDAAHAAHKYKLSFTPFVLMLALSVHSIFEGIAVGLADDK